MTDTDGENSPKACPITDSSILWGVPIFSHDSALIDNRYLKVSEVNYGE